ncbi:hypothetical protein CEXT_523201 [Caerostris extrusa]|uniref:Uncharacterized protein n=1 Tax=Caerostris extrusa TaxID=172846 RepID=A0AAV4SH00_CAEEX|nr:hypothetical protein CEXT_523201 [Caerostris extrusa]
MEALADRKRKKKRKLYWNISALSYACSTSQQQLPTTHSFHFLCDAGSEIGAVLPTGAAPKMGSSVHRFPLSLKSPIIFNRYRFTLLCLPHPFALIRGS